MLRQEVLGMRLPQGRVETNWAIGHSGWAVGMMAFVNLTRPAARISKRRGVQRVLQQIANNERSLK